MEAFHAKINTFLRADIEAEIAKLTPQIEIVDEDITAYEKQIMDSGVAKSLSQSILTQYASVMREIEKLTEQNNALRSEMELSKRRKEIEELLSSLRRKQGETLYGAQEDINAVMARINDEITGGGRTAPILTLKPDKSFEFETPDDKSEGTAYKSLVVYDLAMLEMTPIPILIHDSSIVKRIEDADFEQILGLYQDSGNLGRQVFIAFDKADTYTQKTSRMLEESTVLHLSVGNELFGTSWSRTQPDAETVTEADGKSETHKPDDE